jgi:hypothetical protein
LARAARRRGRPAVRGHWDGHAKWVRHTPLSRSVAIFTDVGPESQNEQREEHAPGVC